MEHSTYIISFVSRVGMTLATLQALTSFWPYAHSKHLGFIGMGGKQGNTLLIISFVSQVGTTLATLYTGSYFFLALCSQQPVRAYWGGGRGERGEHSTYIISFASRVGMTLATLQALTSAWP